VEHQFFQGKYGVYLDSGNEGGFFRIVDRKEHAFEPLPARKERPRQDARDFFQFSVKGQLACKKGVAQKIRGYHA
jgi:hypothetical protein